MELMITSQQGIDLIKQFEGCKLTAYKPVATEKYYTIGYGHYGEDIKPGMTITQEHAEMLLMKDLQPAERLLNRMGINFKQRQFDALVSWIYNLGAGNFNKSGLKRDIISGKADIDIANQIIKWVNAGGKPLMGLKRRRIAEANMFLGADIYHLDKYNNITFK